VHDTKKQKLPLCTANAPGRHTHWFFWVLPGSEKVLPGQRVQATLPVVVLYVPAAHAAHVPPLDPVYPTLHRQCVISNEPVQSVLLFDGQSMQGLEPKPVLYLPKGQLRQLGGLPVKPPPHKHEDELVCACSWCPAPAAQPLHSAEPMVDLNVPTPQAVHVPPLGPVNPRLQRQEPTAVCDVSACPEFAPQA
jgi:hypothetical protein